ncbi:MAG: SCP2 sterol-binding domain-containing protein, partial [Proteobacteria bacterium]|nr:SCP2 sterol-binding domain-containing protein [Pseudomonadota bacterium]
GGSGGWEVPASAWEWRLKENAEGRGLQTFDHGHHLWTTAWFLLGRVERVAAWIDTLDGLVDSPAVVIWKYRDGVRYGMCEYAYAPDLHVPSRYYANDEWIEITGSRGLIVIHRCTGHILDGPALSWFDGNRWTGSDDLACDWSEGFKGATRNFVAAIRGEEPPLLDGEQAREVLRLSLAISKASRVRREVYLDEFAARIPWLYTRARIHLDKKRRSGAGGLWARLGLGGRESGFAPQADTLTRGLMDRLRTEALEGWEAEIGLHLLAQGGVPESEWSLSVRGGRADLSPGRLPERPDLVLRVPAGTWAAVLSGHKRIEVALLQGRLKLEGRAELGLKLRSAFGL